MGNTFENLCIPTSDAETVKSIIRNWLEQKDFQQSSRVPLFECQAEYERCAFVLSNKKWTIILYSHLDGSSGEGGRLLFELGKLKFPILHVSVIDSDTWGYQVHVDREDVESFNSSPYAVGPDGSTFKDMTYFCRTFGFEGIEKKLQTIRSKGGLFKESVLREFCGTIGASPAALEYRHVEDRFLGRAANAAVVDYHLERLFFAKNSYDPSLAVVKLHDIEIKAANSNAPGIQMTSEMKEKMKRIRILFTLLGPLFYLARIVIAPIRLLLELKLWLNKIRGVQPSSFLEYACEDMLGHEKGWSRLEGNRLIDDAFGCSIELPAGARPISRTVGIGIALSCIVNRNPRMAEPEAATTDPTTPAARPSLKELAGFFLRLGTTAFGGPAAHIALMEDQLVTRRKWITREEFLDRIAAANLIPGPSSTEVAIYIGYQLRGIPGLFTAGICFILPAVLIVMAIAWAYVEFKTLPATDGLLYGVQPVLIPILLQAAWRLGKGVIKSRMLIAVAIVALALSLAQVNPAIVLFGSGLLVLAMSRLRKVSATACFGFPLFPVLAEMPGADWTKHARILGVFAKIGCLVFGSGYVLLNFLRDELISGRDWLTEKQLLTAIAVGQVTPGPVFTTATFIGYLLGGPAGGIAATVGIFLPAFIFVAFTGPLVGRMRRWPPGSIFLDGLNAAAIALIVAVTWELGRAAVIDIPTIVIAAISGVLLFGTKLNSSWLVLGGGLAGLLIYR